MTNRLPATYVPTPPEDLGCPHCGRTCDVCVDTDAALAQSHRAHLRASEERDRLLAALMEARQRTAYVLQRLDDALGTTETES